MNDIKEVTAVEKNYRAELVGVLGDPVDGNPTGVMEEAGFEHDGLNWRYITVKVLPGDLRQPDHAPQDQCAQAHGCAV